MHLSESWVVDGCVVVVDVVVDGVVCCGDIFFFDWLCGPEVRNGRMGISF